MDAIQIVLFCLCFCYNECMTAVDGIFTQDYRYLCPYNNLCQSTHQKANLDDYLVPCCETCSCDPNCYETGSCCPDAPVNITGNLKYPCTKVFSGATHDYYFHVIDDCKNSSLADLHPRCFKPEELNDLAAVSDPETGRIYKNMHCAICHDVHVFETWNLHIGREDLLYVPFQSMEDRDSYIFQNLDECEVFSKPTHGKMIELSSCFRDVTVVKRCNITHQWDYYDRSIEDSCQEQRPFENTIFRQYTLGRDIIFANIFCFLCNMPKDTVKSDLCEPISYDTDRNGMLMPFTAILRKKLTTADAPTMSLCRQSEIWDPYTKLCRLYVCPGGTIPEFGECKSVLRYSEGVPIVLIFNVTIEGQNDEVSYERLLDILGKKISTKIAAGCEAYGFELHWRISYFILKLDVSSTKACSVHGVLSKLHRLVIEGNFFHFILRKNSTNLKFVFRLAYSMTTSDLMFSKPSAIMRRQSFQSSHIAITSSILTYCARIQLTIAEIDLFGLFTNITQPDTTIKSDNVDKEYVCVEQYFKARQFLLEATSNAPIAPTIHLCNMFIVTRYFVILFL